MENISISLGNYFEQFVNNQVSDGKYKNIDEVIQAGLSLLEKEGEILALKTAISEGLNSPRVENFDFKENLKLLKEELGKNG
jgi:antitoxin ParD1/3/4